MAIADKFDKFVVVHTAIGKEYNKTAWWKGSRIIVLKAFFDNGDGMSSWRHQMETFSALLAICAGSSPVPSEFPAQMPVTRSFDVFCAHINSWVNNGEAGDLRSILTHYDVTVVVSVWLCVRRFDCSLYVFGLLSENICRGILQLDWDLLVQ